MVKVHEIIKHLGYEYGSLPVLHPSTIGQITTQNTQTDEHRDFVQLPPQESFEFEIIQGPAVISNMWFTIAPFYRTGIGLLKTLWRALRYKKLDTLKHIWIKIYFDDESTPSIAAPFGDFFGCSFGEYRPYYSKYLGMTGGGYICMFPMPFQHNCRILITNTHPEKSVHHFYGAITYSKMPSLPDNLGYFHARYRNERTQKGIPYTILQATGKGHYLGCHMSAVVTNRFKQLLNLFYLEGDCNIYIDGEKTPSLSYTGTEDYFMGGWYYNKGPFHAPTHGLTLRGPRNAILRKSKTCQYRFHFPDAINFQKSIKVTINHGEFNQVSTMHQSVAYWYQTEPHDNFFES
ncbi:MAG: glycoside hydrolase family 172 protein [Candidatus Helarchaeota archaeon]